MSCRESKWGSRGWRNPAQERRRLGRGSAVLRAEKGAAFLAEPGSDGHTRRRGCASLPGPAETGTCRSPGEQHGGPAWKGTVAGGMLRGLQISTAHRRTSHTFNTSAKSALFWHGWRRSSPSLLRGRPFVDKNAPLSWNRSQPNCSARSQRTERGSTHSHGPSGVSSRLRKSNSTD